MKGRYRRSIERRLEKDLGAGLSWKRMKEEEEDSYGCLET